MPLARLKQLNTKECLWIYILKILSEEPTHAYVIRKKIKSRFGFVPGTMTAYKVLYLLKTKGYVKKTISGRKKIYMITDKGRSELRKAISFYRGVVKNLSL